MFIISMGGGLGNQMFEIAFYYSLKQRYPNATIKMDTKYAFLRSHNGIEVFDVFGLNIPVADYREVKMLVGLYPLKGEKALKNKTIRKLITKFHLYPNSIWVQKDFTEYYSDVERFDSNKSLYLLGPFANYKYFNNYRDIILDAFRFPQISEEKNVIIEKEIESSNSVSIHLRRGDYIQEGIKLADQDYYSRAISIITKKVNSPRFFIFTDDIEYATSIFGNMPNLDYTFVEGNTKKKSYRDMQLMSLCKHNIIANSTFSFWGAYLNTYAEKIVIAPNLPFTGFKNTFTCDEWMVI